MLVELKKYDQYNSLIDYDYISAFRIDYNVTNMNFTIFCDELSFLSKYSDDDYQIICSEDLGVLKNYNVCKLYNGNSVNFIISRYTRLYHIILVKNKNLNAKLKMIHS